VGEIVKGRALSVETSESGEEGCGCGREVEDEVGESAGERF
jgi:hypothetical protein